MTEGGRGEGSQKEEIMAFEHISVLLYETVDGLNVKPDGIYVDATLGGGGHAYEVCSRLGSQGRLIGIDQDADAIRAAGKRLECRNWALIKWMGSRWIWEFHRIS